MGSAVGAGVTAYLFIRSVSFSVEMRVLKSAVAERNINSVTYLYGITRKNIVKEAHLINHAKIFYNQRHNYTNVKNGEEFHKLTSRLFEANQGKLQDWKKLRFDETEIKALFFMNLVSGFWDFGNKYNPDKVGCVGSNEDNKWQRIPAEKITIQTYLQSNIGCCNDYAYFLKYLLDKENIKSRLVIHPGHIFNEVWLNGSWRVLDANTGLYINKSWEELLTQGGKRGDLVIYQFPRHDASPGNSYRQVIPGFQIFMLQKALVGGTKKEIKDIEYPELPEWFSRF